MADRFILFLFLFVVGRKVIWWWYVVEVEKLFGDGMWCVGGQTIQPLISGSNWTLRFSLSLSFSFSLATWISITSQNTFQLLCWVNFKGQSRFSTLTEIFLTFFKVVFKIHFRDFRPFWAIWVWVKVGGMVLAHNNLETVQISLSLFIWLLDGLRLNFWNLVKGL